MIRVIDTVHKSANDLALAQQPRGFQVIESRKVGKVGKTEMVQEGRAGAPCQWTSRCPPATPRLDPAKLQQDIDGAARQTDTAYFLDFGTGDRLMIGDDRQHLERGARQRAFLLLCRVQTRGDVGTGAKGESVADAAQLDPACPVEARLDQRQQLIKLHVIRKLVLQFTGPDRFLRREDNGLDRRRPALQRNAAGVRRVRILAAICHAITHHDSFDLRNNGANRLS